MQDSCSLCSAVELDEQEGNAKPVVASESCKWCAPEGPTSCEPQSLDVGPQDDRAIERKTLCAIGTGTVHPSSSAQTFRGSELATLCLAPPPLRQLTDQCDGEQCISTGGYAMHRLALPGRGGGVRPSPLSTGASNSLFLLARA